jgi:hypothetical protein
MPPVASQFERDQTLALLDRLSRLTAEGPVFVAEVAGRRRTHPATVTRWMLRGVRGPDGTRVYLEHFRQGAKLVTSWPAVDRFLAALQSPSQTDATPVRRSPTQRTKAADRAERELEKAGW